MSMHILPADCHECRARLDSVFSDLQQSSLDRLNEAKECSRYRKGQVVYREGTRPYGVFCVKTGRIKEYKSSETGHDQIVRLSKAGDMLGYEALLSEGLHDTTAEALEDSALCFIPQAVFFDLLTADASLCSHMMQMMSLQLQSVKDKVAGLALKTTRERLAKTLLELRDTYGLDDDSETLNIPLTREELAGIVGAAPESVIRLLSEFRRDRMIELGYHRIRLVNIRRLRTIAGYREDVA